MLLGSWNFPFYMHSLALFSSTGFLFLHELHALHILFAESEYGTMEQKGAEETRKRVSLTSECHFISAPLFCLFFPTTTHYKYHLCT